MEISVESVENLFLVVVNLHNFICRFREIKLFARLSDGADQSFQCGVAVCRALQLKVGIATTIKHGHTDVALQIIIQNYVQFLNYT